MRGIMINKDVENYDHDVFKGLTLRQLVFIIVGVAAGLGAFAVVHLVFYVSSQSALLPCAFVSIFILLIGFVSFDDMTLMQWLKESYRTFGSTPLTYDSAEYSDAVIRETNREKILNDLEAIAAKQEEPEKKKKKRREVNGNDRRFRKV